MLKRHHNNKLLDIVDDISVKRHNRELRLGMTLASTFGLLLLAVMGIVDPDIVILSLVCVHLTSSLMTEHFHNKRMLRLNSAIQKTANILVNASQEGDYDK